MKLFLFFSLLVAVYAHGDCGGDCLKACRSCPELENDGEDGVNGTSPFKVGSRIPGDCKTLVCQDKKAVLIVSGEQYDRLVCFQGKWHFGYPKFLEETASAMCLTPGNMTCDKDASIKFEDNFKCVCNPPFKDRTVEFGMEDVRQVCSNCENKKLNIVLLVDNSGSITPVLATLKAFIATFVKFLKVSATSSRIALVTSSWSYEIPINFNDAASVVEASIGSAISSIAAEGQSNLGSGMEAVKAAVVQPAHTNDAQDHKLIVFTDGSVKHAPPLIKDITIAANNLEALGVETFVIATNNVYKQQQKAIANGVVANVFEVVPGADNFDVIDKLQKRVCV